MDRGTRRNLWEARSASFAFFPEMYHALEPAQRAAWAADVLTLGCSAVSVIPTEVARLRSLMDQPDLWPEAFEVFHSLRARTLSLLQSPTPDRMAELFLRLAENAAMVVYNASGSPMPFDYACGIRLGKYLRELANQIADPEFGDRAFALLDMWYVRAKKHMECGLLRDVLSNPFNPSLLLPSSVLSWKDGIVVKIAERIDADNAFDCMPILHDALLDAGCTNEALLSHCRHPEGHVLGCWAVDLVRSVD